MRFLNREKLERLGQVLDGHKTEYPWPATAIRLLTLTGARLSEVINLKWDEIGELGDDGASARLEYSKTGPRTIWLGPEAARLFAELPRSDGSEKVFPEDLTSARLYTFWVGIRKEAGLPSLRIHDTRHTWASQGVMNGVGLTTVGRLLGHRRRRTTAIYAHLDDGALQDTAAQAAAIIARAMGYKAKTPVVPEKQQEELPEEQGNAPDGGDINGEEDGGDADRSCPVRGRIDEPVGRRRGPAVSGKAIDAEAKRRGPDTPARGPAGGRGFHPDLTPTRYLHADA